MGGQFDRFFHVNQIIEVNEEQDDNISQLQTDVQVLEQSINQVQNEITNVQDDIQNLVDVNEIQDNSISQINLAIAQINNNIADNINDIDDLQNQIDDIEAGIGGNQDLQSVMDKGKIQDDEYYSFESGVDYDGNSKEFKITLKPDDNYIGMSQSMKHLFNPESGLETNIDFGSEAFANKGFSLYNGDYTEIRNGVDYAYQTLTSDSYQLEFSNDNVYKYWYMDYDIVQTNSDIRITETVNGGKRIFSDDNDVVREVRFTDDNILSLVNRNYDNILASQIEMTNSNIYISVSDEELRTEMTLNTGGVDLSASNGRLLLTETKSLLSSGSNFLGMDFTTYGFVLNDAMFSRGLRGNDYYGNNYDDNTYVQKKYVDDLIDSVEPTVPTLQEVLDEGSNAYISDNLSIFSEGGISLQAGSGNSKVGVSGDNFELRSSYVDTISDSTGLLVNAKSNKVTFSGANSGFEVEAGGSTIVLNGGSVALNLLQSGVDLNHEGRSILINQTDGMKLSSYSSGLQLGGPVGFKMFDSNSNIQSSSTGITMSSTNIEMNVGNSFNLGLVTGSASIVMDGTTNPNINLASKYRVRIFGVSQSIVKSDELVYLDAPTVNINQVPSLDNTVTKGLARKSDGNLVEYTLSSGGGLQQITESGNTGWRFNSEDPANHASIGLEAIDMTINSSPSTSVGAAGYRSVAIGAEAVASGSYAFAIGRGAYAESDSFSIGQYTIATDRGIAIGINSEASVNQAIAIGYDAIASNSNTIAIGNGAQASGSQATSIGVYNVASGDQSFALGYETEASGDYSTSFGRSTEANGDYSVAFGNNSEAGGYSSFAIGDYSYSIGSNAIAMGNNNQAIGVQSTVIGGYNNIANANNSYVFGYFNTSNTFNETIFGAFSEELTGTTSTDIVTEPIFRIGVGTDFSDRKDGFKILKNGLATLPVVTNALISADTTGKAIVTREFADSRYALIGTIAPVSATASGNVGEIRVTSTYIYTCVATNTWVRTAVATW